LPHKPVAHPDPRKNARLQPGADGGLTNRAELARKVGTGFRDSPFAESTEPAGAGLAGGPGCGRSLKTNPGPVLINSPIHFVWTPGWRGNLLPKITGRSLASSVMRTPVALPPALSGAAPCNSAAASHNRPLVTNGSSEIPRTCASRQKACRPALRGMICYGRLARPKPASPRSSSGSRRRACDRRSRRPWGTSRRCRLRFLIDRRQRLGESRDAVGASV
jgi:hypothetical protein